MNNLFPDAKMAPGATGALTMPSRRWSVWRDGLPAAVRSPVWHGALATLIIFGMLLAFHHVVRGAVHQGEQWRKSMAINAEAKWRCNSGQNLSMRDSCLSQQKEVAPGEDKANVAARSM